MSSIFSNKAVKDFVISAERNRTVIQEKEITFATAVKIQRAIDTATQNNSTLEVFLVCKWGRWYACREIEPDTEPRIEQKDHAQLALF